MGLILLFAELAWRVFGVLRGRSEFVLVEVRLRLSIGRRALHRPLMQGTLSEPELAFVEPPMHNFYS